MQHTISRYHDPIHFFASSTAEWQTSENLDKLIEDMKSKEFPFSIWLVPLAESAEYSIESYAPKVDGKAYLGTWSNEG